MGIEQYNEGRKTPGRESSTRTGRGIEKLFEGIGSFFERKEKPTGVELYNQPEYRSFGDRIIPGSDKFITENYARPFGKWASETVPTSFKKWNQSYQKGSPITGDTSRDYKSQFGDIGKWLVNTPTTWATFGADVATDLGEFSAAMVPKWAGGEGRGVLSKEQKYAFEQGMVDKFGMNPISKNNPYVKYDWGEDWDGTKKSNPIIHETKENLDDFMYNDFLNDHIKKGIVNDIGIENLEGKSRKEQNNIFHNAFLNKYEKEWDMYQDYEFNKILKDDYDIGSKGTPGAIGEFELDFNYDPMIPYSTEETGFLEGSTKGLGISLANLYGGPGMFSKGKKFIPKWRKKAGIMNAAKGTKYEDASQYFDGL